ncbi:MAG: NUDIX domain-containing protein [Alphaproteobacteria bacterium]|nr:NUDIX domain-containing protein [Alphaproteobacteria bacterium]
MATIYKSEGEFLAAYDANAFDRPSATSDVLIFSVSSSEGENWRRAAKKAFSVLLVKRDDYPFLGKWNLPGGFVKIDETSANAAMRILKNETGVADKIHLEQLYTFDTPNRDPRTRVISIAHMALVDKALLHYAAERVAKWFDVEMKDGRLSLCSDGECLSGGDLAFDHAEIIKTGVLRMRGKIEYTDIVFDMMPAEFTLGELQQVYEAVLDRKLLPAAFRRVIADKVEATGGMQTGLGHRPSALFRYKR